MYTLICVKNHSALHNGVLLSQRLAAATQLQEEAQMGLQFMCASGEGVCAEWKEKIQR